MQVSRNGIDSMMRRFISEAFLLANDNTSDVTTSSDRFNYLWTVGRFDLHSGFYQATLVFVRDTLHSFNYVTNIHTALFVVSWVAGLVYVVGMFRPYYKRNNVEVRYGGVVVQEIASAIHGCMFMSCA
jgi:hypothetical protein